MLMKTAKNILKKSFRNTKDLVGIARKGYSLNLSEASSEMEQHMVESAKALINSGELPAKAINNNMLKLSAEEAFKVRYNDTSLNNGVNTLIGDMAQIGAVAAAGIVGLKVTQGAVSVATGDW